MDLYDGRLAAQSTVNVQQQKPRTSFKLDMAGVQAGPLLKDYLQKELIAGTLNADLNLNFSGDETELIRRTLDGSGKLEFVDGAIIGIDLAGMVRNVQAAFGLTERPEEKPRTDFTEFLLPFIINSGQVLIKDSRLQSPLLRVQTQGTADLTQEKLNLRIEPKFVDSLKGQGDTKQRSGIMVPVNVTGSFSDPKFKPDVKSIVQQLPQTKALQEGAEQELEKAKQKVQTEIEEKAQELFERLPFGSKSRQPQKE
jgi:AsmA protein